MPYYLKYSVEKSNNQKQYVDLAVKRKNEESISLERICVESVQLRELNQKSHRNLGRAEEFRKLDCASRYANHSKLEIGVKSIQLNEVSNKMSYHAK